MIMNVKCRLCLKKAPLCNSHVIPEFFYKQMNLYSGEGGEIHRFNILSTNPNKKPAFKQKGIHEKLLCKQCEEKFSKWENYARRVLYGGECLEIIKDVPGVLSCKVDYEKFKLFQLSILWRVGISTYEGFSSVKLGNHENVLREMLYNEAPGSAETYGFVNFHLTKHTDITSNAIHCMGSDYNGIPCALIMLGGSFWIFFLSEISIDSRLSEYFLQENGYLRTLMDKAPNALNGYIESLVKDIYNANHGHLDRLGKNNQM